MTNFTVSGMTPFVPAKILSVSKQFYCDMGFSEVAKIDNAVLLELQGHRFWLQDYYVEAWATNTMFCLYVDDLNAWQQRLDAMDWENGYGAAAKKLSEPHRQEGALMMQVTDPSGVLWHIRQAD